MAELGSGNGSSYPSTLDTNNTLEVNSPNAGKTKARAEVINDVNAAVVAIQTELGTDPAGTLTDVKTYLQTEHTDGKHAGKALGALLATDLTLTGSAASPPDSNTLVKDNIIKGWLNYKQSVPSISDSFNVASVTDDSAGRFTINWNVDFLNTLYAVIGTSSQPHIYVPTGIDVAGTTAIKVSDASDVASDSTAAMIIAIGDQ